MGGVKYIPPTKKTGRLCAQISPLHPGQDIFCARRAQNVMCCIIYRSRQHHANGIIIANYCKTWIGVETRNLNEMIFVMQRSPRIFLTFSINSRLTCGLQDINSYWMDQTVSLAMCHSKSVPIQHDSATWRTGIR
jgi:hypothetical protein